MIPTYRPQEKYLKEVIDSVLIQDPGPEHMQIEIVDDCSTELDVAALVQRLTRGRASVSRNKCNLGLAGCWNACLARARGRWVHLLHQDDILYPGFYAELETLIAKNPEAGAAFARHAISDANGHWRVISELERSTTGALSNWAETIASGRLPQCVSIAVRRDCYETIGGFRTDLPYVLDWEMWARIGRRYPVVFSPRILAAFREHGESTTARLQVSDQTLPDFLRGFSIILADQDESSRPAIRTHFLHRYSGLVWEQADRLFRDGQPSAAMTLIERNWTQIPAYRKTDFKFLYLRCLAKKMRRRLRF